MKPPVSFPSAIQAAEMETNRYSPDNVSLHGPSSRRRSILRLTSPFGMDVVSEVVVDAVVAVGAVHRGQIATSVSVTAALGCLQLPPAHPGALLLTGVTVFLCLISLKLEPATLRPKLCAGVNPVTGSDLISVR